MKRLISLAARAACLEIGRAWRQAHQAAPRTPGNGLPQSPPSPIPPEILAVREEIYRRDPALWNSRIDAKKETRA